MAHRAAPACSCPPISARYSTASGSILLIRGCCELVASRSWLTQLVSFLRATACCTCFSPLLCCLGKGSLVLTSRSMTLSHARRVHVIAAFLKTTCMHSNSKKPARLVSGSSLGLEFLLHCLLQGFQSCSFNRQHFVAFSDSAYFLISWWP